MHVTAACSCRHVHTMLVLSKSDIRGADEFDFGVRHTIIDDKDQQSGPRYTPYTYVYQSSFPLSSSTAYTIVNLPGLEVRTRGSD
jgi:hypothetical protein